MTTTTITREDHRRTIDLSLKIGRQNAREAASTLARYLRSRADDVEHDLATLEGVDGANEHGSHEHDMWRWLADHAGAPVSDYSALNNLNVAIREITIALAQRRLLDTLDG